MPNTSNWRSEIFSSEVRRNLTILNVLRWILMAFFLSLIGVLKDITGSWSASIRVAGSFAIIAASLLAIENVIARGQWRKSNSEKEVQCDENVSWILFFCKVPWNRLLVYYKTDVFCCWWCFCAWDFLESQY